VRAVWLTRFGGPEVLVAGDAPDPAPGPAQALIDVEFANVTFVETQFRASGAGPFDAELPMIPGNGIGGLVAAVGADADPGLVGMRAVAGTSGSGGYAERVAVDAGALVEVPEGVRLDDAVALLADGRTATGLVRAAGVRDGDRVLVEAAAGGVGTLLVQLARAAGARVVAAAGGVRKLALARELGAEVAVDYREPGWPGRVLAALDGRKPTVLLDGVGGEVGRAGFEMLDTGGRIVMFGWTSGTVTPFSSADIAAGSVSAVWVTGPRMTKRYGGLRGLETRSLAEAAAGRLVPLVHPPFPLADAAAAHRALEGRRTAGKVVLAP
jgi:NADPH:quinone reductase